MTRLKLAEYETEPEVELTVQQRDLLRQLVPSMSVTPTPGRTNCYDLTPGKDVGAVQLDGLSIEIQPKIPIGRVLFLLSYALGARESIDDSFSYQPERSLLEAVIPSLVRHVKRAVRPGLLQGYRIEEESLATVRGRIRFGDQIQRRYALAPPVEVSYDDFTEKIHENCLIKAAIAQLGRMRLRDRELRTALRRFDLAFSAVPLVVYDPRRLPEIIYSRLNMRYRPAVELSKLILQNGAFELRHGDVEGSAVLFDMAKVVENFVAAALRDELGASERSFCQGAKGRPLHLDMANRIGLEPDLSWWEGHRCRFVGDVKYKVLNDSKGRQGDLYQLLAYTVATELPGGLLIYAATEAAAATHTVRFVGKRLEVCTLNLCGNPKEILAEVAAVARRIRRLSRRAA